MKPQKSPEALETAITNSASTYHWEERGRESQSRGKEDSTASCTLTLKTEMDRTPDGPGGGCDFALPMQQQQVQS